MLKFIFYLIFMIPFFNKLVYYIYGLFFFFFFFFLKNFFFFDFSFISYIFGMDYISFNFICLSIWICLMISLSLLSSFLEFKFYYIMYLNFILFFLILVFSVMDFFYFYFFFEGSMLPVIFILFGWGYQPERLMAGFYLIFYTLFGSFPFLLIIFYMMSLNGGFSYFLNYKFESNFLMFFLIFSFLIKFPMFGVHSWLPSAHVEAPVGGSMILAGVLLKLGGYGFIRLTVFMYKFIYNYSFFFISLSLWGCVIISFLCIIQSDLKMLIAYSSVCHMSLVIVGLFTMSMCGFFGSLCLMIGHGFVSSGLFFLVGIVYSRFSSRSFFVLKGLISILPSLSFFWFLFCLMNMSCPPSINLFSEILIVISCLSWSKLTLIYLFFILFLSACYSLTIFFLTQHGNFSSLMKYSSYCYVHEYFILILHCFPVFFMMIKLSFFFG
uniref:NADH dehydrogenase subunit 4 n=1 Tax=Pseudosymplanella nigrifasciata TaxID=2886261 RepID=UPI001E805E49|nr:NADH dehydrogenase subunit 4 [Pseudosymplanella nigrifasciata]UDL72066.1 NADH dehydrogenase subunit 4 [Pseudosymplanella nigrifasciata]